MFDVDVADGVPPLKLPMDKAEDPYDVAERFLMRHGLPDSYLEQVVSFIQENTAGECALLWLCRYTAAGKNGLQCLVVGRSAGNTTELRM